MSASGSRVVLRADPRVVDRKQQTEPAMMAASPKKYDQSVGCSASPSSHLEARWISRSWTCGYEVAAGRECQGDNVLACVALIPTFVGKLRSPDVVSNAQSMHSVEPQTNPKLCSQDPIHVFCGTVDTVDELCMLALSDQTDWRLRNKPSTHPTPPYIAVSVQWSLFVTHRR